MGTVLATLLVSLAVVMAPAHAQKANPFVKGENAAAHRMEVDPLTVTAKLNPSEIEPEQIVEVQIKLKLLPEYKAYEDQFKITTAKDEGFQVAKYHISPIQEFYDDFSKRQRRGVIDEATLTAAIGVPKSPNRDGVLELNLTYQACTKTFCLFPKTIPIKLNYSIKGDAKPAKALPANPQSAGMFEQSFEEAFSRGLGWTFFFVFIAGILTSFTPCIFPMIPITLAVLAKDSQRRTRAQSFLRSLAYVFGIATTYSILGVFAASTGALFGSAMSSPWVLGAVCAVFLAMALSLFGFYEIEVPHRLQRALGKGHSLSGNLGAFVTGLISGIVASPCVGPILVGILAYVAQSQNLLLGFSLLFVFAFGMGQLFLALGLFTNLSKKLPKSGGWLNGVKNVSGLLMLGAFYYHLELLMPQRTFDIALAVGLIILGSLGGAFQKTIESPFQKIAKGAGWAMLMFGSFLMIVGIFDLRPMLSSQSMSGLPMAGDKVPGIIWQDLNDQAINEAKRQGKPVVIDFYADWCAACHELDRITFVNPRVIDATQNFVRLRFDATRDSEQLAIYKKRYGILGLPWVVLIDAKGEFRKDLTLTEFEEPVRFLDRLNKL
ncbi:MAG: protein-disulfide reductase DsbD [Bdellovibrionaceae bacterium]|nr:protein-disulfide reductase DsbD [Pseudobdellovibrionaceae bacterium]